MKSSVYGLVFLATLFCTLQSTTATIPSWLEEACKNAVLPELAKFCPPFNIPLPVPGNGSNNNGSGSGNAGESGAGNASDASPGAPRSLPITGGLPLPNLLSLH